MHPFSISYRERTLLPTRLTALSAVGALLALTACDGAEESSAVDGDCEPIADVETINDGELTVLVAEHPPFMSLEGDELVGIDATLINNLAEELCLELNASQTSFAAVVEGLQSERADISSGNWGRNAEREENFEISDGLYYDSMGILTTGEDWSTAEDLDGLSLGTPQGYLWNDDLFDAFGEENVSEYQSDTAVLDEVVNGRIDAGIVSINATVWHLENERYSDLTLEPIESTERIPYTEELAVSVALIQHGNTALRGATNEVLAEYYESGELEGALEEAGLDPEAAYPENR